MTPGALMPAGLAQLDPPLSTWFTAHCPHCPWRRNYSLGPAGWNLATIHLLDHVEQRHPRAWRRHLRTTPRPLLA
jgi:hypothetical protein